MAPALHTSLGAHMQSDGMAFQDISSGCVPIDPRQLRWQLYMPRAGARNGQAPGLSPITQSESLTFADLQRYTDRYADPMSEGIVHGEARASLIIISTTSFSYLVVYQANLLSSTHTCRYCRPFGPRGNPHMSRLSLVVSLLDR